LDLWDTTPDLAGNDLDVSRYIRDTEDNDVQFFWREWDDVSEAPPDDPHAFPGPARDELCSVSIGQAIKFVEKLKTGRAWRWDPLGRAWLAVDDSAIRPGMVLLLRVSSGGYEDRIGWTGKATDRPTPHPPALGEAEELEGMDDEKRGKPVPLTQHLTDVATAATQLQEQFSNFSKEIPWDCIIAAARWHDVGKSHPAFQTMLFDAPDLAESDAGRKSLWAKSNLRRGDRPRYRIEREGAIEYRRGFRHELASAIAWLTHNASKPGADLIAFLIAAHHGKVRGSIRSLPNEYAPPEPERPFARGLWEGDVLPPVDLGNGETMPETTLSLGLMRLGDSKYGPSWVARVIILRDSDDYGPFRLSLLETLVRIADWRGSEQGEVSHE
jgi:CRISPR-associated endonuclease/helicase Cas3